MASGFLAAANASMRAFGGGRRGTVPPVDPAAVSWAHALLGVAILIVAVAASILLPGAGVILQFLPQLLDILLVTFATLAVPFLVLIIAAIGTRQREKLPILVLFTSLSLLLIQATSLLLSFFSMSTSSALIVVTAFFVGRAARTVLGFSIFTSILVGLVTAAGIFVASSLLLVLPTGQAMLDGA